MKFFNYSLLLLSMSMLTISCGSDPEPYDDFLGNYTAQKFCNDDESFTSKITPGASGNQIIWINAAGEDGAVDDLNGTITGTSISISRQNIGGSLDMSATGSLLENGKIEMTTTLYGGPLQIFCNIDFTPQ